MKDELQRYCLVVDCNDFDTIGAMWEQIYQESNKGLEAAIFYIHSIFDDQEDFTLQLLAVRNKLNFEGICK